MSRESFILKLVSAKMITPKVRHLEFVRADNQPLNFIAGQFITFHFTFNDALYQRSYSIASIPNISPTIEIAVSPYENGPGTKFLFSLQPGDEVETTGPFGRLILRDEVISRYILISTGTG